EALARLDALAVQLLDEAHVAALMAPGFRNRPRVECHACQPRTRLALHFHLVGADHALRHLARLALIEVLLVRPEVGEELLRRDGATVTEINLLEGVALLVPQVAGQIDPVEEVRNVVDAGDALTAQDVALAGLEDEDLLPERASLVTLRRLGEAEAHLDRNEVLAAHHLGIKLLRLGADLWTFDVMLGQIAVQFRIAGVAVVLPAWAEKKVHDVQAEAGLARSGFPVEE